MHGQNSAAVTSVERAVDLNPNSFFARQSMGIVLVWAGRNSEAIKFFDEALRLSPNDPASWTSENVKAVALGGEERYEEALAAIERVTQQPASDFWPYLQKAFVLLLMGNLPESKAALAIAREMHPNLSVALVRKMLMGFNEQGLTEYTDTLQQAGLPEE